MCGGPDTSAPSASEGASEGASESEGDDASTSDATQPCASGQTKCDGACVLLDEDPDHCGGCGIACAGSCVAGACAIECDAPEIGCDGVCVNPETDYAHCGDCETICALGQVCALGNCIASCMSGEKLCGGGCVDPNVTLEHCGACDSPCPEDENGAPSCVAGSCLYACDPYYVDGGGCVPCSFDEVLADNPVHLWRLSELSGDIAYDEIGGADGLYVDATLDQDGDTVPEDRAVSFSEGLTSRVVVDWVDFPQDAFTVEVVARIDAPTTVPVFVSLASGDDAFENNMYVAYSNELTIYHYSGDAPNEAPGLRANLARGYVWHTGVDIDDGQWHHIALSWSTAGDDVSALRFYVDGVPVSAGPTGFAEGDLVTPGTFVIGMDQDAVDGGYTEDQRLIGTVDSVVIYDEVLPPVRIAAHATWVHCGP